MIFQGIDVSGSFDITGSFVAPKGAAFPLTASSTQGDVFFHTSLDTMYVFTNSGSWTPIGDITSSTPPTPGANIEYLLVAGGGGGGRYGGGGGAGGYLSSSLASVTSGSSFTVTVGGGGAGHPGDAQSGGTGTVGTDSSIAEVSITTITSNGGGGGGNYSNPGSTASNGGDGGSGGGGGRTNSSGNAAGGSGTVGQGNDGGGSSNNYANHNGGGGGGAGAAGTSGVNGGSAGGGGNGLASSITGTSITRAGGGGGSHQTSGTVAGGSGGGGTGYGPSATATTDADGDANTGGGGGGTSDNTIGGVYRAGNGGSGVAIFAYNSGSLSGLGGVKSSREDGHVVHTFNTSGTLTVAGPTDYPIIPSQNFDIVLKTYGTSGVTTVDGLNFQPDLVWDATRNQNYYHRISDSVRGVQKSLRNTTTDAESNDSFAVQSFTSDGFTTKNYSTGDNHVAWCWKAGGASVSNSDGLISSTISANPEAGFSVVTYTGNLSGATTATGQSVGHGLNSAPELIMYFNRGGATNRVVSIAGDNWSDTATLTGNTITDYYSSYPMAAPTDSVFYTNYMSAVNINSNNHVAYCWHSVPGYSKIGTYTGTSGDITVNTGFRPIFVAVKAWSASGHWEIHDARRYPTLYEDTGLSKRLRWTDSSQEAQFNDSPINFTSTGFVLDSSVSGNSYGDYDNNGVTYLYFAISE